jgi:hypothetical protein
MSTIEFYQHAMNRSSLILFWRVKLTWKVWPSDSGSASIAEPLRHEAEEDKAIIRNVFALLERNSFYSIRPVPRGMNRPLRERIGSVPFPRPEGLPVVEPVQRAHWSLPDHAARQQMLVACRYPLEDSRVSASLT